VADHIESIALHAMKEGFPIHSPAVGSRISSTTGAVPGCRDDRPCTGRTGTGHASGRESGVNGGVVSKGGRP
jgi:hypothetical protein